MDYNKIDVELYLKISADIVAYKEKKALCVGNPELRRQIEAHIERLEGVIGFIEKFASEDDFE